MPTSTPPQGLRARKNARTRKAITRAALELSLERGYEHATVAQIAERADVSPRTVHAWFASKEDIVVGTVDPASARLRSSLDGSEALLDRLIHWAEGERGEGADELSELRCRVLAANPHLRAAQRARYLELEEVIAVAVAAEVGLPGDAVAPRAFAAALLTAALRAPAASEAGTHVLLRAAFDALRDR